MQNVLSEFKALLEVSQVLMGPNGCPWDREQTLVSVRGSLLEEAYEVIEAIDDEDYPHLKEELGDLFYNVLFFAILGEKEKRFTIVEVLQTIREKLIERHPHVFGDGKKLQNTDQVTTQWETIKNKNRESLMDGIPKALPALARSTKMIGKMKKANYPNKTETSPEFHTDEELGKLLWAICSRAKEKGLNPEHALRECTFSYEKEFRSWEKKKDMLK